MKLNDGRWIAPHQEFHRLSTGQLVPLNLSNLRVYGCRTYVRIQGIPQPDKMHSRAEIGYLVGYKTGNVWRVWFPRTNSVKFVRDAVFDENIVFKSEDQPKEILVSVLDPKPIILDEDEVDLEIEQALRRLAAEPITQKVPEASKTDPVEATQPQQEY